MTVTRHSGRGREDDGGPRDDGGGPADASGRMADDETPGRARFTAGATGRDADDGGGGGGDETTVGGGLRTRSERVRRVYRRPGAPTPRTPHTDGRDVHPAAAAANFREP